MLQIIHLKRKWGVLGGRCREAESFLLSVIWWVAALGGEGRE
jgi:hypothetical protein